MTPYPHLIYPWIKLTFFHFFSYQKESISVKDKKKSSWKKFFGSGKEKQRTGSDSSSNGQHEPPESPSGTNLEYVSDPAAMLEKVPTVDVDLIHFVVGHGILRRELR